MNAKFNQLFHNLKVIQSTLGCKDITLTLYLLQVNHKGLVNLALLYLYINMHSSHRLGFLYIYTHFGSERCCCCLFYSVT